MSGQPGGSGGQETLPGLVKASVAWVAQRWGRWATRTKALWILSGAAVLVLAVLVYWGPTAIKDVFSSAKKDAPPVASGPSLTFNAPVGQFQVGDHNTQTQTLVVTRPPRRKVPKESLEKLTARLRAMPPLTYDSARTSSGVGDTEPLELTGALLPALDSGGWKNAQSATAQTPVAPGVTLRSKPGAAGAVALAAWCKEVGLLTTVGLPLDRQDTVDVLVTIGPASGE